MMVNFPICLKVTLVNPGCNNRFICYFDGSDRFSGLAKGFLDSDVIFGAVGLGSEQKDISTQIYDCMFYTIFFQIIFDTIRNVSFGDIASASGTVPEPEVKSHNWETDPIVISKDPLDKSP